ncbi:hypothetical protein LSTR_LSTR001500 [Laodelphax striatellus]|uniref:Uncharacterized protein n=1 Tax=Laodelphax striatellus TaxID=195883 RepID=A0A482X9Q5_LAOST|nr:hypothetical protein LSTR_LSTR001500 [Laodelphax striatellus]
MNTLISVTLFFMFYISFNIQNTVGGSGRHLLYTPGCVLQFAVGFAVPTKVNYKSLAANGGILLNMNLPSNLSHFFSPYDRKQRIIDNSIMEDIHEMFGLKARNCMEKSVCQLRDAPLIGKSIFSKALQILAMPKMANSSLLDNCEEYYSTCPYSLVDMVSEVYQATDELYTLL